MKDINITYDEWKQALSEVNEVTDEFNDGLTMQELCRQFKLTRWSMRNKIRKLKELGLAKQGIALRNRSDGVIGRVPVYVLLKKKGKK